MEDGAVFNIYDSTSTLYGTYETKKGKLDIVLPYGKYRVIQTSGKEGYKLVEPFNITIDEFSYNNYKLYDELIYGNLILNKYYGEEGNYTKEDGAIFKVSNETNIYEGTTVDGMLSMSLPYGNYRVTQLKGIEGYDYVEDFDVDITNEPSDYDLYDEIIVNVPNTGIYDKINYSFLIYIFFGLVLIIYSLKKTTQ